MSDSTATPSNTATAALTKPEEPVLSDEQILEFEQQIKDEEAQKVLHSYFLKLEPSLCTDTAFS